MNYLKILSASSSRVIPRCAATSARMPERVPTRSELCFGTVTWCSPLAEVVNRIWLPVWRVSSYPQIRRALTKASPSKSRGNLMGTNASGREDFFLHDVQTHHARSLARLEVALHRIGDLLAKIVHRVRLGIDRLSEGPSGKAAPQRFFDHEDQFTHSGTINDLADSRKPDYTPQPAAPSAPKGGRVNFQCAFREIRLVPVSTGENQSSVILFNLPSAVSQTRLWLK